MCSFDCHVAFCKGGVVIGRFISIIGPSEKPSPKNNPRNAWLFGDYLLPLQSNRRCSFSKSYFKR